MSYQNTQEHHINICHALRLMLYVHMLLKVSVHQICSTNTTQKQEQNITLQVF